MSQPYRVERFKLSNDRCFKEKVVRNPIVVP